MTADRNPSTTDIPADGVAEPRDDGGFVLRYERRLDHPIERVWASLTEPEQLEQWLAAAEVEPVVGGRIVLRWLNTDDEGNQAVMTAAITRFDPPRLLEYEGDVHGRLRWELRPDGDGCVLTLTNETSAPPEHLVKVLAGWHVHLDFLEDALAGHPVDWPNWPRDRWQVHADRYAARYG
jgi:uncharacterized protein YndB with AHSA1/START domain